MMKGKNKDGEEIDLRYSFPLSPPAQKKLTVWVVDDEKVRDEGYNITFDAEELLKYAKHKLGPQILEALQLNFANGDILECLGKDRKVEKEWQLELLPPAKIGDRIQTANVLAAITLTEGLLVLLFVFITSPAQRVR